MSYFFPAISFLHSGQYFARELVVLNLAPHPSQYLMNTSIDFFFFVLATFSVHPSTGHPRECPT